MTGIQRQLIPIRLPRHAAGQMDATVQKPAQHQLHTAASVLIQVVIGTERGHCACAQRATPTQHQPALRVGFTLIQIHQAQAHAAHRRRTEAQRGMRRSLGVARVVLGRGIAIALRGASGLQSTKKALIAPLIPQLKQPTTPTLLMLTSRRCNRPKPPPARQPGQARAQVAQPRRQLRVAAQRELIGEAVAHTATGHQFAGIVERFLPVVLANEPQLCRPMAQAFGEQLLAAVKTVLQRRGAAHRIRQNHLRRTTASQPRNGGERKRTRGHLALVFADAIDEQFHLGWQRARAHQLGNGRGDSVRLQRKVARNLDPANARGACPGLHRGQRVAEAQRHHRLGIRAAVGRVEPRVGKPRRRAAQTSALARTRTHTHAHAYIHSVTTHTIRQALVTRQHGMGQHLIHRERPQLARCADAAAIPAVNAIQIVVEQQPRRIAGRHARKFRHAESGVGPVQQGERQTQLQCLLARIKQHNGAGQGRQRNPVTILRIKTP